MATKANSFADSLSTLLVTKFRELEDGAETRASWASDLCTAVSGIQAQLASIETNAARSQDIRGIETVLAAQGARTVANEQQAALIAERLERLESEVSQHKRRMYGLDQFLLEVPGMEQVQRIESTITGMNEQISELDSHKANFNVKLQVMENSFDVMKAQATDFEKTLLNAASLDHMQSLEQKVSLESVRLDECLKSKLCTEQGKGLKASMADLSTKLISATQSSDKAVSTANERMHGLEASVESCTNRISQFAAAGKSKASTMELEIISSAMTKFSTRLAASEEFSRKKAVSDSEDLKRLDAAVTNTMERSREERASFEDMVVDLQARVSRAKEVAEQGMHLFEDTIGRQLQEAVSATAVRIDAVERDVLERVSSGPAQEMADALAVVDGKVRALDKAVAERAESSRVRELEVAVKVGAEFNASLAENLRSKADDAKLLGMEEQSASRLSAIDEKVRALDKAIVERAESSRVLELEVAVKAGVAHNAILAENLRCKADASKLSRVEEKSASRISAVEELVRQKVSYDEVRRLERSITATTHAAVERSVEEQVAFAEALAELDSRVSVNSEVLKTKAPIDKLAALDRSIDVSKEAVLAELDSRMSLVVQVLKTKVSVDQFSKLEESIAASNAALERSSQKVSEEANRVLKTKASVEQLVILERSVAASKTALEQASEKVSEEATRRAEEDSVRMIRLQIVESSVANVESGMAKVESSVAKVCATYAKTAKRIANIEYATQESKKLASEQYSYDGAIAKLEQSMDKKVDCEQLQQLRESLEAVAKRDSISAQIVSRSIVDLRAQVVRLEDLQIDKASVMAIAMTKLEQSLDEKSDSEQLLQLKEEIAAAAKRDGMPAQKVGVAAMKRFEQSIADLRSQVACLEKRFPDALSANLLRHLEDSIVEGAKAVANVDAKLRRSLEGKAGCDQVQKLEDVLEATAKRVADMGHCARTKDDAERVQQLAEISQKARVLCIEQQAQRSVSRNEKVLEAPVPGTNQGGEVWPRTDVKIESASPGRDRAVSPGVRNLADVALLRRRKYTKRKHSVEDDTDGSRAA